MNRGRRQQSDGTPPISPALERGRGRHRRELLGARGDVEPSKQRSHQRRPPLVAQPNAGLRDVEWTKFICHRPITWRATQVTAAGVRLVAAAAERPLITADIATVKALAPAKDRPAPQCAGWQGGAGSARRPRNPFARTLAAGEFATVVEGPPAAGILKVSSLRRSVP
jgi:hypothetical protein